MPAPWQRILVLCTAEDRLTRSMGDAVEQGLAGESEVTRLPGDEVSRWSLEQAMVGHDLLLYAGHGRWDELYSMRDPTEPLLDRSNVSCLRARSAVAFACRSGRDLGPAAVDRGAEGYLGFTDDLAWPMHETVMPLFARAMSRGVKLLARGGSLGEVRDMLASEHLAIYEHYWHGPGRGTPDGHVYAMFAEHLAFRLVVHGNAGARPLEQRSPLALLARQLLHLGGRIAGRRSWRRFPS